jgi:hypothetical protein
MGFGTLFTLFVVPVVYLILSGKHDVVEAEAPESQSVVAGAEPLPSTT